MSLYYIVNNQIVFNSGSLWGGFLEKNIFHCLYITEEDGQASHMLFTVHVYQYRIEKANQAGIPGGRYYSDRLTWFRCSCTHKFTLPLLTSWFIYVWKKMMQICKCHRWLNEWLCFSIVFGWVEYFLTVWLHNERLQYL